MPQRFVVEGYWTGYTSSQSRVVHREVVQKKRAEKLAKLHKIIYTDGTALIIYVRKAEFREKVKEIHSYDSLVREAEISGKNVYRVQQWEEKVV